MQLKRFKQKLLVGQELQEMTKTAFLFAGQGAQYLGMGRELYDQYAIVKETIDQASQVLGYDLVT